MRSIEPVVKSTEVSNVDFMGATSGTTVIVMVEVQVVRHLSHGNLDIAESYKR